MNLNFKVLDDPKTHIEYEHDLLALANRMFDNTPDEIDKLETQISQLNRLYILHKLATENLNDPTLISMFGTDVVACAASDESMKDAFRSLWDTVTVLGAHISQLISAHTVSEKYIYSRFDDLQDAINRCENVQAIVSKVPTFEEINKRLIGVMNIAGYMEMLSKKDTDDPIFQDSLFEKVAALSNGVLKVSSPRENSGMKNLIWRDPDYTEYDIMSSKWTEPQQLQAIRNLTIQCKYNAAESFAKATKNIKKVLEQYTIDQYSEGNPDYGNQLERHSAVSLITKMCKQAYKNAVEREINTLCISWIYRLCHYKYI